MMLVVMYFKVLVNCIDSIVDKQFVVWTNKLMRKFILNLQFVTVHISFGTIFFSSETRCITLCET